MSDVSDRWILCSALRFFIQITVFLGLLRWRKWVEGGPASREVNGEVSRTYMIGTSVGGDEDVDDVIFAKTIHHAETYA